MPETLESIRILIADPLSAFRHRLRAFVESEPDFHIVAEAADRSSLIGAVRRLAPDVLFVDCALLKELEGDLQGGELSQPRIVATLPAMERGQVMESFRFGARGIVLKTSNPHVWVSSVRSVMAGQYWFEPESVTILIDALRGAMPRSSAPAPLEGYRLTPRERDIIARIATGQSNKRVGEAFSICERTVKHHLTNIFGKVGVSNRLELAIFAVNNGLTQSSDTLRESRLPDALRASNAVS